ncbi:MAG: hypothetical protein WAT52_09835 [Chitinophagales bacterium]
MQSFYYAFGKAFYKINFFFLLFFLFIISTHISIAQVDTISVDTITYSEGDTVDIYTSGLDSVYITYAESIPDSIMENLWIINNPYKQMIVELSHQSLPVNEGVIGINLSDFFSLNKANFDKNVNYTQVPDPWQAIADLAPNTLRIFSGASAKFMHPTRPFYNPVTEKTHGGYGYDWTEMISYFNATESSLEPPLIGTEYDLVAIDIILDAGCLGTSCDWAESPSRLKEFYDKSVDQPIFDPTDPDFDELHEQPMYINQFIDLVDFIETENSGLEVEVIYCVNIESMSASEMMDVIGYLFNNDINLIGVELGNEVYNQFSNLAMGFTDFDHYWKYINGDDYTDPDEQEALELALADDVVNDHDYILAIKDQTSPEIYSIKIGLPAMNTPNCGRSYDFPLFAPDESEYDTTNTMMFSTPILTEPDPEFEDEDCDCFYADWNADMVTHYGDKVGTFLRYAFNAIIFHPYYNTTNTSKFCEENFNWRDIMLQLHPSYNPSNPSAVVSGYIYTDDPWEYVDDWDYPLIDTRLEKAFFELAGIHYPEDEDDLIPGNFKEFTRDRIDNSFEEHAGQMLFTKEDDGPESKEIWLTEYNLNDDVKLPMDAPSGLENIYKDFQSSGSNTFAHAAMLQNWMLWNIKANYDNDYKKNFLTRATLQNALGGSATMLMTNSDAADQKLLEEIDDCTDPEVYPYFKDELLILQQSYLIL